MRFLPLLLLLLGTVAAASPGDRGSEPAPAVEPAVNPEAEADRAPVPAVGPETVRDAIDGAVAFLLATQNEDGSFGYHSQQSPYKIYAPVPGAHRSFKAAVTALVLIALREVEDKRPKVETARSKALAWLLANARVKRSSGDELYNVWAYGYALQAYARVLTDPVQGMDRKAVIEAAKELVRALALYQTVDGGWGYFDFNAKTNRPSGVSMSFTTATNMIALEEAQEAGIPVPAALLGKAALSLERSRTPEGTYVYSFNWRYSPAGLINRPQGSLTRNPVCDLALLSRKGGTDLDDLERSVRNLLAKRRFARMALHRPVPHESWFAVSGYFYLFGYFYAAEAYRLLPGPVREELRDALIAEILVTRHPDGSFWDYPLYGYHKPYGTAYALAALSVLRKEPAGVDSGGTTEED